MQTANLESITALIELVGPAWQAINEKRLSNDPSMSYPELDELSALLDTVHTTLSSVRRRAQWEAEGAA